MPILDPKVAKSDPTYQSLYPLLMHLWETIGVSSVRFKMFGPWENKILNFL